MSRESECSPMASPRSPTLEEEEQPGSVDSRTEYARLAAALNAQSWGDLSLAFRDESSSRPSEAAVKMALLASPVEAALAVNRQSSEEQEQEDVLKGYFEEVTDEL